MSKHYQDELGERCKQFEQEPNTRKFFVGQPLIARIDGRAFHTFTRGLEKPYDKGLMSCMQETTNQLVEETDALLGYTQSDEITLVWFYNDPKTQLLFDGKQQKLTSVLASMATIFFYKNVIRHLTSKMGANPMFDCRVWQTPNKAGVLDVLTWREWDAVKNSISMLAQYYYSHKELMNKDSKAKHDMIHAKGDNWNNHPAEFKRGYYTHRVQVEIELTEEELNKIPEKNRPVKGTLFKRTKVKQWELPPLTKIKNLEEVIFNNEAIIV